MNHAQNLDVKDKNPPSWRRVVYALLLAAPALWTGGLILHYGVDVPYCDQWEGFCSLLEKMDGGRLRLADFFALHNEHRIFFPRLIMFSLAKLTHWNVRAELLVIWFLACACAANIWRLACVTGWRPPSRGYWSLLAAYVLMFTPLEMQNWTWGIQIGFLLPPACVTACLWIAPSVRFPINFLLTMALSTVCTFSIASGFACWILTVPLLLLPGGDGDKRDKTGWWLLLWMFSFLASLFLYFNDYHKPSHNPGMMECFKHPIQTIQYFLAYLGSAFAWGGGVWNVAAMAQATGAALALAVIVAVAYFWHWRRDTKLVISALPWLMLVFYTLLHAALTVVGRQGFGITQALSSRYLAFSVMLPIGLVFLTSLFYNHWRAGCNAPSKTAIVGIGLRVLTTGLILVNILGSLKTLDVWRAERGNRLAAKALLLLINVAFEPECSAKYGYTDFPLIKTQANLLNRLGYLRPPLVRTKALHEIIGITTLDAAQFGQIQQAGKPAEGQFAIAGWSILPDQGRPADAVLLTYDDAKGEPIIFALTVAEMPRMDVTNTSPLPAYLVQCGWVKTFNASRLPPGAHSLRAWAFDAEVCRAYPMQGNAVIER